MDTNEETTEQTPAAPATDQGQETSPDPGSSASCVIIDDPITNAQAQAQKAIDNANTTAANTAANTPFTTDALETATDILQKLSLKCADANCNTRRNTGSAYCSEHRPPNSTVRDFYEYDAINIGFKQGSHPTGRDLMIIANQLALEHNWETIKWEPMKSNLIGINGAGKTSGHKFVFFVRRPVVADVDPEGNMNLRAMPCDAFVLAIQAMKDRTAAAEKAKEEN